VEATRTKELAAAGTTCVPQLPARTISYLQSLVVARDKRGRKREWHVWLMSYSHQEGASWSEKLACSLCKCGWLCLVLSPTSIQTHGGQVWISHLFLCGVWPTCLLS